MARGMMAGLDPLTYRCCLSSAASALEISYHVARSVVKVPGSFPKEGTGVGAPELAGWDTNASVGRVGMLLLC